MQAIAMHRLWSYFRRPLLSNAKQRRWGLHFGFVAPLVGSLLSSAGMPGVSDGGFRVPHAIAAPSNCVTPGPCDIVVDVQAQRRGQDPSVAGCRAEVGVNLLSTGNSYAEYQDPSSLDDLLRSFWSAGLKWISLRVVWSVVEPNAMGRYDDTIARNIGRIIDRASGHDIDVMLDFHTLFGVAGDENWTYPRWAHAGPGGDQRGSIQIARDPGTRRAYASMQQHIVGQLADKPALKVISVVNEPWGRPDDGPDLNAMIADLAAHIRLIARQKVAIRLAAGWVVHIEKSRPEVRPVAGVGLRCHRHERLSRREQ